MATVDVEQITTGGLAPTPRTASAGGDKFIPGDNVHVWIKNASAGAITADFVTPGTVDGLAIADRQVSVPAGADRLVLAPAGLYRNPTDGLASITWSATASVTFYVLRT